MVGFYGMGLYSSVFYSFVRGLFRKRKKKNISLLKVVGGMKFFFLKVYNILVLGTLFFF